MKLGKKHVKNDKITQQPKEIIEKKRLLEKANITYRKIRKEAKEE